MMALVLCPLLVGLVNRTKSWFAGRCGPSVLQLYFDLWKLLRKSSPRSATSTWLFDAAPAIGLVATVLGGSLIVLGTDLRHSSCLILNSSLLFVGFYFLGTARFFSVLAARDVASAFPDMGAAREVQFSALIEAVLFAVLAFVTVGDAGFSVPRVLAAAAVFVILLAENCRVPFDDPETHLELTMIHEAMILDNSGPDLALILYSSALKLWVTAVFFVRTVWPASAAWGAWQLPCVLAVGVLVGAVESSMARMRFRKTPFALACAFALAVLALVLEVLH